MPSQCAVELQQTLCRGQRDQPEARRIVLRIGINLGDVIVEGSDLYGDGVNVAARLEIWPTRGHLRFPRGLRSGQAKLASGFDDLACRAVKNIAEPVHVYRVRHRPIPSPSGKPLPLPDKPSIAVLPFTNMSTDPEQETFADGLTEDLITDLSSNAGLFVIARNSTFAYKDKSVDVRRIANDLGVRYLLEGSARRAAGRVRINVQLIDAVGGGHLWAERFDRSLEDIFAVQDEVTAKIVEALVGRLAAPPARKWPKSIDAYDLCVRARMLIDRSPRDGARGATAAAAGDCARSGLCRGPRVAGLQPVGSDGRIGDEPMEPNRRVAVDMAERAVALDPNDAGCRWVLGYVLAYEHRWPESDAQICEPRLSSIRTMPMRWADSSDHTRCLAVVQMTPSNSFRRHFG